MNSLGFSEFRHLMDLWDESLDKENYKSKVESLLDTNKLLLFFKKVVTTTTCSGVLRDTWW